MLVPNLRLEDLSSRFGRIEGNLRFIADRNIMDTLRRIRDNKVVETVHRHKELLTEMQRDFDETRH